MPGTQAVRRLMLHKAQGAKIQYGDGLFVTWSPNEQQSALVVRLIRNRRNDPLLQDPLGGDERLVQEAKNLRDCSGIFNPSIMEKTYQANASEEKIELPLYNSRRKLAARDARAVVAAYMLEVKFKLPWLLGLRCCPRCPQCSSEGTEEQRDNLYPPCQDIFGTNTMPMGGIFGLAATMGGATEFQKATTPHFHAFVHHINVYQYGTLADVATAIKKDSNRNKDFPIKY